MFMSLRGGIVYEFVGQVMPDKFFINGVDGGTKIEPDDIYNLSYFDNVVNLIEDAEKV